MQASDLDRLTRELPDPVRVRITPMLAVVLAGGYVEGGLELPVWLLEASGGACVTIPAHHKEGGRREFHGSPSGPAGGASRVHAIHGGDDLQR